ncbi:MAG: phosphodiesterase [Pseudonocardiales bacterium]|nr:MAG: phosphodiesterase [Pseudonocardiales bacterium]
MSVDGMHQADLKWFVSTHPRSALASLVGRGTEFTDARTPFPSDSFPGLIGAMTGGKPKTTGIYYDVTYNHALIDPGASADPVPDPAVCTHPVLGANVAYDESLDRDTSRLDAGQGLPNLPGDILQMTAHPRTLINPVLLPIDPQTCHRVYPHSYLKVNTVFEVAKAHGLRTAWSDKHPAYEILNGPSGTGVDDLFTPEINSDADTVGDDWTGVNSLTRQYDHYKVRAVLNEISGYDHSGRRLVGTPAIFGMNFQSVSTAEKLPVSDGQPGGYDASGTTPGPVLRRALEYVDGELGTMVAGLKKAGRYGDTTIILSAKHGQSPMDSRSLKRIDDGAIVDGLNAVWHQQHADQAQPLVAASLNDDGMLLWFSNGNRTPLADRFAADFIRNYNGDGTGTDGHAKATDIATAPVPYTAAGLREIHSGLAAARFFGTNTSDPRVPDLVGLAQHGIVYTAKTSKIAEHGGNDPQDRHVPLVVAGPGTDHEVHGEPVETTRIAPTILRLLGLDPNALDAVRAEHTAALDR